MEQLLDRAGKAYDYVLIDLPPVLAVTDAALLGNLADGVVLVVRSGMVAPEEVQEAKKTSPGRQSQHPGGSLKRRSPSNTKATDTAITITIITMRTM